MNNFIFSNIYWMLPVFISLCALIINIIVMVRQNRISIDQMSMNILEYRLKIIGEVKRIYKQIGAENEISNDVYFSLIEIIETIKTFYDKDVVSLLSTILDEIDKERIIQVKLRKIDTQNDSKKFNKLLDDKEEIITNLCNLFPKIIDKMYSTIRLGRYRTVDKY